MSNKKSFHDHLIDFIMGSKTYSDANRRRQYNQNQRRNEEMRERRHEEAAPAPAPEDDDEYIEFTYKPGMTFGQAILDHNLATEHGLWGEDGDVAYYNQQLYDAGIYGNIPVGSVVRLKKRK